MEKTSQTSGPGAGLPPRARITRIQYNDQDYSEEAISSIDTSLLDTSNNGITWIDFMNVADTASVQKFGQVFSLHPIIIEDILDTKDRPKIIDSEDFLLFDFNVFMLDPKNLEFTELQHCVLMTKNLIVTFQEGNTDFFREVKDRLRNGIDIIRKMGLDFLLYSLIDFIVGTYFTVMDDIEEVLDNLETDIVTNLDSKDITLLQRLKRNLIFIRKSVWPVREILNRMETIDPAWISKGTHIYMRNLYDHVVTIIDIIETSRDILSSTFDIYLSSQGNKLNNIVKILTIISVIFIPLNFITGFFGMNWIIYPYEHDPFNYIGLVCVICTMIVISYFATKAFKKRKWL